MDNSKRIDGVITVERKLSCMAGWLNKYCIQETGKVFYEQTDDIEEAYLNFCTQVDKLTLGQVTLERAGQVRSRRHRHQWLHIYYLKSDNVDKIIASTSDNIHKVYLGYMQLVNNRQQSIPPLIRKTLCCSGED